jgi:hypothetical protein
MFKKAFVSIFLSLTFMVTAFAAWNGIPLKNPRQFNPSVVNIEITKKGGDAGTCTGSFFDRRNFNGHDVGFIITAGHCIPNTTAMDIIFTAANGKPFHSRKALLWVRHERLLDPDATGQVQMGDFNAHEIHDVAIIMIEDVPDHARPLPLLYNYNPKTKDTLYILSRKEQEKHRSMSPFVSVPITDIKHISANGSVDIANDKTSLLFEADIVQPKNQPRGICPGDSGGAVVAYRKGKPYTVGVLSAMYNTFPITHDRVCGRSIMYYGVSFNKAWIEKAVEHLLSKAV